MATYVLVHGGFSGGWMYRELANRLRARGHEVYTPTLTGLGEREHLGTPETGLSTHIQDVVNVIEFEDLRGVVLVGYSYGGVVVTGVADRVPERVAHLVYLEGDLPVDGESGIDAIGAEEWEEWKPLLVEDGWRIHLASSQDLSAEERRWRERYRGQPRRSLEEKLHLRAPTESHPFKRTFVAATNTGAPRSVARVRDHPAWRLIEVEGGHFIVREASDAVERILLDLA